jgi:crossover junction endonuclease MUS81
MYETKLYIDHREGGLKTKLLSTENVIYKNLDYGDIIIDVDDKHLVVCERKTLSDLSASLKDGRYKNQKQKLLSILPINCLYYIIEGPIDFNNEDSILNGINKKTMLSCIINTLVRDNIKILITKDLDETCNLILNMFDRIKKDPGKYVEDRVLESQVVKTKNKNTTKEGCFEQILCQIPDISTKTAKALCVKFSTMKGMYDYLNNLSYEEKLKLLKEIYIEDVNGKKRKIAEKVLKNIIEYLF